VAVYAGKSGKAKRVPAVRIPLLPLFSVRILLNMDFFVHQSDASNGYDKYPASVRCCQGDNTAERAEGLGDPIARG
jgi:hypothetical protein